MREPKWLTDARKDGRIIGETPARKSNTVSVYLDVPPSTNNLFLNARKGRVRSPQYRAWIKANAPTADMLTPVEGRFRIVYTLGGKVNTSRDLANIEKALTDLLVMVGAIPGDSIRDGLHEVTMRYDAGFPCDAFVKVEIQSLPPVSGS
jgi:hypothetical protein